MKNLFFGLVALFILPSVIPSAAAQMPNTEVSSITCYTVGAGDGWSLTFRSDGSASIAFGSGVQHTAHTGPGIFSLRSVHELISPHLKGPRTSNSKVAVAIFRQGQTSSSGDYVDDLKPFQALFRKAMGNATIAHINSFKEVMVQQPPFGVKDVSITEEQAHAYVPPIRDAVGNQSEAADRNQISRKATTFPTPAERQSTKTNAGEANVEQKSQPPISSKLPILVVAIFLASLCLLWLLVKWRKYV